jgi:hypothetical protein
MAHRIAPPRLLAALGNTAAGITLIITPVLLCLGIAGPGQAAQAATTAPPAAYYILQAGATRLGTFGQLAKLTTSDPARIVLKDSPLADDLALYSYWQAEQAGTARRVDFTLTMRTGSPAGPLAEEWDLKDAYVSRLELSGVKAGTTEALEVSVTIVAKTVTILSEP